MVEGLEGLHAAGSIHRNLKPEGILLIGMATWYSLASGTPRSSRSARINALHQVIHQWGKAPRNGWMAVTSSPRRGSHAMKIPQARSVAQQTTLHRRLFKAFDVAMGLIGGALA